MTPAITGPGVYDIPEHVYHADPVPGGSLSSTGARRLLPPSCPALFKHERDHGAQRRQVFDVGSAAHRLVLGAGADLAVIDAGDYRSKAARDQRDAAYAAGTTPVLSHEFDQVNAMATAVERHPVAGRLFAPGRGDAERTLAWIDEATGVWCRARLDWMCRSANGRLIVVDYKTTTSAEPSKVARAIHDYGYHQQASWYLDGVRAVGLDVDPAFIFAFQEKAAPHLITVVELDAEALRIGAERNRRALEIYARCTATGEWPGYTDDITLLGLPAWAERQHEEEEFA